MIEGQAQGALRSFSHTDASWAEVGKAIKAFKRAGIKDIVLVGRMVRPRFKTAKPDFGFLRSLPAILRIFRAGGDDAVLRAVIAMFERRGLQGARRRRSRTRIVGRRWRDDRTATVGR